MENTENTQVEEVKLDETVEATAEVKSEDKTEETAGEVFDVKEDKKSDTVPLSVFLELKKDNKELQSQMKKLEKSIQDGATKKEISTDLKSIAEKHGVDEDFLQEFASMVEAKAEAKISDKLKNLTEKEKNDEIDRRYENKWNQLMVENPEYSNIANKDVIKALALMPQNSNKSFVKILEEAYGHLISNKNSIESSSPRGGKNDNQDIDFERAKKDVEYFREILADPELKKKYNKGLENRIPV